ncbi:hypothetical protein FA95DRAFT_946761 [Auriscalpium vulgare]|uniref:Uncharacterized protein n=1 Tax=Auriscalpium vulgare TaxID=40419 RepID=A0ACB8SAQ2_9AGAM|nr:hypothetical protein FA95DRAFT_946761 [Auriscalpium vulgare]
MPHLGSFHVPWRFFAFASVVMLFADSAIMGSVMWEQLSRWPSGIDERLKGVTVFSGIFYTILLLSAALGFFGVLTRRALLIGRYAFALLVVLPVHILVSILRLWVFFSVPSGTLLGQCQTMSNGAIHDCVRAAHPIASWALASAIGSPVFQLFAFIGLLAYSNKLLDEEEWTAKAPLPRRRPSMMSTLSRIGSRRSRVTAPVHQDSLESASVYSVEDTMPTQYHDQYQYVHVNLHTAPEPISAPTGILYGSTEPNRVRWESGV